MITDPYIIALIGALCLVGLIIAYFLWKRIYAGLKWVWKKIVGPPVMWVYNNIFTPIGHCGRDFIFVWKECFCGCCDSCDECCNPYKRI